MSVSSPASESSGGSGSGCSVLSTCRRCSASLAGHRPHGELLQLVRVDDLVVRGLHLVGHEAALDQVDLLDAVVGDGSLADEHLLLDIGRAEFLGIAGDQVLELLIGLGQQRSALESRS